MEVRDTVARTVRYGIIGCGMMGQEHIRNTRLLSDIAISQIYEPDRTMRGRASALAPEASFSPTLNGLVEHPEIDALVIASPNWLHLEQLERISRTRSIPVLIEKPLYTSPADESRARSLAGSLRNSVWVAMEYRYMPPIAEFIRLADKVTGGIRMLTIREHRMPFLTKVGNWNRLSRLTGGTLVEKCCHFFDLMRLIVRSRPIRIMASAGQDVNHIGEFVGDEASDILDNAYVIVDFANGVRAMLELCMFAEGSRYQEEICAVGRLGRIEAFVPGPTRFWPAQLGQPPVPRVVISPRSPMNPETREIPVEASLLDAGDHNGATYFQHKLFLEVVRTGKSPEVTLADGLEAVRMGHAAQESARSGRTVELCQ